MQFGDAAGKYTNDFGGTSSACPGAAGVAALVLSVNPDLRWNEVKDILRRACDRIDPAGGRYDAGGHSEGYGYGRLNAEAAVMLAKQSVGRQVIVSKLMSEPIPDLGSVQETIEATEAAAVEKVALHVRLEHTWIGDLVITAVPPPRSGVGNVVLHDRAGGSRHDIDMLYDPSNTFALGAFAGKDCSGTWTIRVEDRAAQDVGILVEIALHMFLAPLSRAHPAAARPAASGAVARPSRGAARRRRNPRD